jgi:hypothetical protein
MKPRAHAYSVKRTASEARTCSALDAIGGSINRRRQRIPTTSEGTHMGKKAHEQTKVMKATRRTQVEVEH